MSDWLDQAGNWCRSEAQPPIRAALLFSLMLHAAALWTWLPRLHLPSLDAKEAGEMAGSLVVQLSAPQATPAPVERAPAHVLTAPRARAPAVDAHARPAPPPAPPVLALNRPKSEPAPPQEAAPSPNPAPATKPAASDDFASFVEARRRARSENMPDPAPVNAPIAERAEKEDTGKDRIVAANLGAQRRITFGYDPTRGGGMFQITHLSDDSAEFIFVGWDRDIRRNTKQYIDVRKGDAADIRWAVVRRMIAIIRSYEQADFVWESWRLGRFVSLSARVKDTAELEGFLMREFFPEARLAR